MPYKRRYKGNYRRNRRRIAPTKRLVTGQTTPTLLEKIASGAGAVAGVAKAVLPMISMINSEMKYWDYNDIAVQPVFATPYIVALSNMPQGVDESNRIGNSILAKNMNLKVNMVYNPASTKGFNRLRVTIFVDKNFNGSLPTTNQIFQNYASAGLNSAFNKDYTDRFAILRDRYITLTPNSTVTNVTLKVYKQLNFHIRYLGSGGIVGDLGQNQLCICICTQDTPLANVPLISLYNRLNFTDN